MADPEREIPLFTDYCAQTAASDQQRKCSHQDLWKFLETTGYLQILQMWQPFSEKGT